MQRAIRILRIALPIAFGLFILIIVLSWNRAKIGKEKVRTDTIATTRPGKVIAESKGFEDTQTVGGRMVSHIVAKRVVALKPSNKVPDIWNMLEDVRLTLYRQNGLTYELVCPEAEFNSETKEANAKGGVIVTSSDGVEIRTAMVHYDGNRLTNNIPVDFRIDRWQGQAGALDLDVKGETLRLFKTLTATMTPALPTDQPLTIKCDDGVFRRHENDVMFTKDVLLTRGADSVTADRMNGRFTPDRKTLVGMEGTGHVRMVMSGATGPGEDLGGRKTIECERFFSETGPDGQIAAINAVGEPGLAHAILDGPPKRDVVARTFRVALHDRAVQELKGDWAVVMKELGDTPREVRGEHVIVTFDAEKHRAAAAMIEGGFKYHDPKTDATAVRATYDIVNDRVILTAIPGFDPTIVTDGNTVKAKQLEFSPKAQTAKATGDVIAELVSKGGGVSADSTNVFPGNSRLPVYVNSDSLVMRQATKVAVFSGNVKAWQVSNTLFAQELQVQGPGQIITARGAVRTVLYNAGDGPRKMPVTSKSEQMIARRNDGKMELTGGVQIEDETRVMTAERATFYFDQNRKIDHIDADTKVVLVQKSPVARKLTGDKATYFVIKKLVTINGSPATAVDPTGDFSGEQIVYDIAREHVEMISPKSAKSVINYKNP